MEQQTVRTNLYSFPMDCNFNSQLANRYIDGELSPAEHQHFAEHIKVCERCAELVADLQVIVDLAPTLARNVMPEKARRRLREALRERVGYVSPEVDEN